MAPPFTVLCSVAVALLIVHNVDADRQADRPAYNLRNIKELFDEALRTPLTTLEFNEIFRKMIIANQELDKGMQMLAERPTTEAPPDEVYKFDPYVK